MKVTIHNLRFASAGGGDTPSPQGGRGVRAASPAPVIRQTQNSKLKTQNSSLSAFTLVEIALCLAIIGFALVAIVGVLPFGLNVQQKNREETIIDQDAQVWMNTLRHGAQGFDDLTNYVIAITNTYRVYNVSANGVVTPSGPLHVAAYTRTHSTLDNTPIPFVLTNGFNIVGLLSTPRYWPPILEPGSSFQSNAIVANVRALSGDAVEKYPQTNPDVLDQGLSYRMAVEIVPYVPLDPASTNFLRFPSLQTTNRWRAVNMLVANSHDIRLLFRWPLLPNGRTGEGRQSFRVLAGGQIQMVQTNGQSLFFLQPSTYGTNIVASFP